MAIHCNALAFDVEDYVLIAAMFETSAEIGICNGNSNVCLVARGCLYDDASVGTYCLSSLHISSAVTHRAMSYFPPQLVHRLGSAHIRVSDLPRFYLDPMGQ